MRLGKAHNGCNAAMEGKRPRSQGLAAKLQAGALGDLRRSPREPQTSATHLHQSQKHRIMTEQETTRLIRVISGAPRAAAGRNVCREACGLHAERRIGCMLMVKARAA